MKPSLLGYLWNFARYRERRDFLSMGYGIAARAERCGSYWEPHLVRSKTFLKNAVEKDEQITEIVLLGAGRLLDVDVDWLANRFIKITLVDADPGALPIWKDLFKNYKGKLLCKQEEITGVIDLWTARLKDALKKKRTSVEQVIHCLETLPISSPIIESSAQSVVVSLNILSQLPIYWRDRVEELLSRRTMIPRGENGTYPERLQLVLNSQYEALQASHLRALAHCSAKMVIILSDSLFSYHGSDYVHQHHALFGAAKTFLDNLSPERKCVTEDSWEWILAPQGIEHTDYSEIHTIQARAFLPA